MKRALNVLILSVAIASILSLTGCGVTKAKYDTLLNEKIALEEKVNALTKANEALRNEYDNLLSQKMEVATKVATLISEKAALKGEYDKLLDEKVSLKAAYDKLLAETKAQSAKRQ